MCIGRLHVCLLFRSDMGVSCDSESMYSLVHKILMRLAFSACIDDCSGGFAA